jgi:hypothetical protein
MVVARSSPCGTAWKNSQRSSIEGGSTTSYDLADDLGINSDNMPKNSGLKHQPAVIVLHHL